MKRPIYLESNCLEAERNGNWDFHESIILQDLARFSMQDSKKGFSPFRHGVHLSKQMCPKTQEERERN